MKVMLHEIPVETVIYGFGRKDEHDTAEKAVSEYRKYDVMLTIYYKSPKSVFISRLMKGFVEELGEENAEELWQFLRDRGVEEVEFNRYGTITKKYLNEEPK